MNAVDPSKHNTVNTLRHWYSFRLKLILEGMLIGSITGFIVVLFRLVVEKIEETTTGFNSFLETRVWLYPVFFAAFNCSIYSICDIKPSWNQANI